MIVSCSERRRVENGNDVRKFRCLIISTIKGFDSIEVSVCDSLTILESNVSINTL